MSGGRVSNQQGPRWKRASCKLAHRLMPRVCLCMRLRGWSGAWALTLALPTWTQGASAGGVVTAGRPPSAVPTPPCSEENCRRKPTHLQSSVTTEAQQALTGPRAGPWPPLTRTHLAVHEDVEANPKHLEEMPAVGPILHEVPGKPWGRSEVGGGRGRRWNDEKHSRWGVPRASGMQGPLDVPEDSPPPTT